MEEKKSGRKHNKHSFYEDKITCLAFLAVVINFAAGAEKKFDRIEIFVNVTRKPLDMWECL